MRKVTPGLCFPFHTRFIIVIIILDDINKILTESQSKYVFTTPTLVSTVHEAGTGLQDIQVKMKTLVRKTDFHLNNAFFFFFFFFFFFILVAIK